VLGITIGSVIGCAGEQGRGEWISLEWTPIDSVNAELPPTIRVYAGENDVRPLRAWYVTIDEQDPSVETRVLLSDDPTDLRETITSFSGTPRACVAVNAGYFAMNQSPAVHAGLLYTDGVLQAPATRTVTRSSIAYPVARAAIGFTVDGTVQVTWATSRNDSLFAWDRPPTHRPGLPADLPDDEAAAFWNVRDAVSAGPMLIRNGVRNVTEEEEVFFGSAIPDVHPRTAAGRTADGHLLLLVVDGRQPLSRGVDLDQLAGIMEGLGAVDALNLDGGGSSALVVNGTLLNRPAGTSVEREVMSALVTFCIPSPPEMRTSP
jgi:exopolysaccharide biosynthesis protein